MASLDEKVAIISGASSGIGKSVAERLASDGASVVITYAKSADKAQQVVNMIEEKGGKALALPADFTKLDDIRNLFQETLRHFGKLDILVISGSAPRVEKPIADVTEEEFDYAFAFNAKGNFFALQEAAKHMADGGRIVTFSTPYTTQPQPNMAVTAGSKAAVEQFTFALAKELGSRGIRVNAVMPGPTTTESFASQVSAELQAELERISPLQRLAEPEDIANAVAFLVSDEAAYVTGHTLHATGGLA
jgi:3-oxoacyl-[acyl-carrier protein] reductase